MILVEPLGGLGNRLRVVDAAVALAHVTAGRVRIAWVRNLALNSRFDALFEPIDGVELVERSRYANALDRRLRLRLGRHDVVMRQPDVERAVREGFEFARLGEARSAYLATVSRFYESPEPLRCFRPTSALRDAIAALSAGFDAHTVGVHLRRGDHEGARRSPTAAFVAAMEEECRREPRTRFYVATDAPADERLLVATFGPRVLTQPAKVLDRAEPEAARDAVIDLFTLARTRKVIGTDASSYSEAAAILGGIELLRIGPATRC